MGSGLERRKLRRLEYPLEVSVEIAYCRKTFKNQPPVQIKSRNISMGGICLETHSLEIGGVSLLSGRPGARENRLRLCIALNSKEPIFEATGQLSWYDVARDTPQLTYHIGIEFLDMKGSGKEQLKQFLRKQDSDSLTGKLRHMKTALGKMMKT